MIPDRVSLILRKKFNHLLQVYNFLFIVNRTGMGSIHQDLEEYSVEEHAERKRLQLRPTGVPTPPLVLPIPTKRRRELLRQSGVRDIDALEKDECESIRASRERCGCACQGRCEPIVCLCILAGISCQVEVFSQVGTVLRTSASQKVCISIYMPSLISQKSIVGTDK